MLRFIRKARTVFSIDLASTLALEVRGGLKPRKGLKLRITLRILLEVDALVLTNIPTLLRVAVTNNASLTHLARAQDMRNERAYLVVSWKTLSSLSSKPIASGSSNVGGIRGWSRGTRAKDVSFCSGRCGALGHDKKETHRVYAN